MLNLAVIILVTNVSVIGNPAHWLQLAEHYGERENYLKAFRIYNLLLGLGFTSPDLLYNTGVCALARGELGEAIYYLRQAAEQKPLRAEYRRTLHLARQYVVAAPCPPRLYSVISFWVLILGLFLWTPAWLLCTAIFFHRGRRIAVAGLVLFMTAALLMLCGLSFDKREKNNPWAVVVVQCIVREGNGESYPAVLRNGKPIVLYPGAEVKVLRERGNLWVCIQIQNGESGWVPKDKLRVGPFK